MWPISQQPWFFNSPIGIVIDASGYIYVADSANNRIQKLSPDGALITKWGTYGEADGQFRVPRWMAIDGNGDVYVTEADFNRIQKFTANGEFIKKWGSSGSGDGQIDRVAGIATDSSGNVYVVDLGNYRIQKFSSKGVFITKWGSHGSGDGEFAMIEGEPPNAGITIDENNNVYVIDPGNHRIQKFNSDGAFITKWGRYGSGDGEFNSPCGIFVDVNGSIYVTDSGAQQYSIHKFNSEGEFITRWGVPGSGDGQFTSAAGIAVDSSGNVYVTDGGNNRIQKLAPNGQFLSKWGSEGSDSGEFYNPQGIAADSSRSVYVADSYNSRIQKFASDGTFVGKWGESGSGKGEFGGINGIAVDGSGNVYATDGSNRVQKFNADGKFLTEWGSYGSGDGEFSGAYGIAVDSSGNVYVTDLDLDRIQKFTSEGVFIRKWGSSGLGNGEFDRPQGITADSSGNIYVTDSLGGSGRLQKFTSNGVFITVWGESWGYPFVSPRGIATDGSGYVYVADSHFNCIYKFTADGDFVTQIGNPGTEQGQLSGPNDVSLGPDGRVYVADTANNRIQVFSTGAAPPPDTVDKAIIVAGGGPYTGNNIWDATEMNANYAYRTLSYQGYTKDTIYYLSSDTDLDLDGNGILDDVDADAANANLQYAINTWAKDADTLFIYMIDHGGDGTFRMSAEEILKATDLDTWLDTLQQTMPGRVTIVYDACESGSFVPLLVPPAEKERLLVTSTASDKEAIFVGNGTISFSFLFWGHIFNGDKFYDAYVNANGSVGATYSQSPQIDANGNGIGNEKEDKTLAASINIGNETKTGGDMPVIGVVSPSQTLNGATSALLYAENVTDANGISRVWAVITPPGTSRRASDNPVTDLPTVDLTSTSNDRYEITYSDFTTAGTYNIAIFAMDRKGVLSLPVQTTLTVSSLLSACDECTGDPVVLKDVIFDSGTPCECSDNTSITIGPDVTVKTGTSVRFKAPKVTVKSGFNAENGSTVRIVRE